MVDYMVMIMVNVFEAKAKLSEFLDAVSRGERVLICKRNRPVAELKPVEGARSELRPVGLGRGRLEVPASFFEPLPDLLVDAFEGTEEHPADEKQRRLQVADRSPGVRYGGRTSRRRGRAR